MGKKKQSEENLPYFKFVTSRWITGDIMECSLSAQGLFINLCALYWARQGKLSYSAMKKKFPRKQKHFDELLNAGILKSNEDDLVISFLDDQLTERGLVSEKNRNIAKEAWNKRKSDAFASETHSERNTNAMPIEEKREEEKREEESESTHAHVEFVQSKNTPRGTYTVTLPDKNQIFEEIFSDEKFMKGLTLSYPGVNYEKAWDDCWRHHSVTPSPPEHTWQWKQKLSTWISIETQKNWNKQNGKSGINKKQQHTSELAASVAETYSNVFKGRTNGQGSEPPS